MHFVLISVLCSVSVAVLLKFARLKGINNFQMIIWNYPVAVLLTLLIFRPDFSTLEFEELPWDLYLPIAVILPSLFVVLSFSLRYAGLVHTEVAQRISLVISLVAAVFVFQESFAPMRIVGIVFGFLSIGFLIGWQKSDTIEDGRRRFIYPIMVFFGYGIVDILFKKVALIQSVSYTTSMFFMFIGAFVFAALYFGYLIWTGKTQFSISAIGWGLILGVLNFGNILFYMKAHKALSENPSVVFTGMNIGVIALGSLVGVWLFKEKLSLFNIIGVFLAIVAVLFIAYL